MRIHTSQKKEEGVALLFAVLMTSMLLLVALGISNVSYKENLFATEARDSGKAFFAADTGIECGLLLHKQGAFVANASTTPACRGAALVVVNNGSNSIFSFPVDAGSCAEVHVDVAANGGAETLIQSFGYNTPYDGLTSSCTGSTASGTLLARSVMRALRVRFPNPTP
jgi:hypothetical protein